MNDPDPSARFLPHWLYRIFDAEGTLLYVGITRHPEQRLSAWIAAARRWERAEWMYEAHSTSWQRYPDRALAMDAEKAAIKREYPVANIQHNRQLVRRMRPGLVVA